MKNYEKIKTMSVEEMAEFLVDVQDECGIYFLESWKKWLEQKHKAYENGEFIFCLESEVEEDG